MKERRPKREGTTWSGEWLDLAAIPSSRTIWRQMEQDGASEQILRRASEIVKDAERLTQVLMPRQREHRYGGQVMVSRGPMMLASDLDHLPASSLPRAYAIGWRGDPADAPPQQESIAHIMDRDHNLVVVWVATSRSEVARLLSSLFGLPFEVGCDKHLN